MFAQTQTELMNNQLTSYPKEKIHILLLENISPNATVVFKSNGYSNIETRSGALSEEDLVNAVKDVHLLGIRSKTKVTERVLAAAKKLQAIGCFCIGVNQVDLKAATRSGLLYLMPLIAIPGVLPNSLSGQRLC